MTDQQQPLDSFRWIARGGWAAWSEVKPGFWIAHQKRGGYAVHNTVEMFWVVVDDNGDRVDSQAYRNPRRAMQEADNYRDEVTR